MPQHRKLATILFADIVGYTAMMQADEGQAMSRLRHYQETLQDAVTAYNGELIKNYGDGSLCIFSSVLDAVQCAKSIQERLQQAPKVPLRIGLHLGDIIHEANDIYEDALNIASRIESIGVAGSVLLSNDVAKRIKNHPEFKMVNLGSFEFKNVEDPMTVFALANEGFPVPDKASINGKLKVPQQKKWAWLLPALITLMTLVGGFFWWKSNTTAVTQALSADIIADKSIAVLAFRDLSPEGDQGYFGDGIAEEILNALDQLDSLRVIGRTSSFSFKGKDIPIPEIAEQLKVSTILEGSVRKFNNRVRINVKLVDAKADQQIWSESFDRELEDIFAIQNEIAVSVANNLKLNLLDEQAEQLVQSSTTNPAAYELFLKARALIESYTEFRQEPIDLLLQAIKIDPRFVDAYGLLATAKGWLVWTGQIESKVGFSQANQILELANNLDTNSKYVQESSFSINLWHHWDWEKIEATANNQQLFLGEDLGNYYSFIGQYEKGIDYLKNSIINDPFNLVYRVDGLYNLLAANQYEEAIELGLENIELFPEQPQAYFHLSFAYFFNGEYQNALDINELGYSKSKRGHFADNQYKLYAVWNLSKLGKKEEAGAILNEFLEKSKTSYIDPIYFAWLYANINEKEKALDYLEQAYESKSAFMVRLKTSPFFGEEIRAAPRFQAILKKMNFPEVVKG